ncbi:MAG: metallophosphoesterase family protein [Candidatus Caldatribacteriaceae bacterium]
MRPGIKILHTADWHIGLTSWKMQREVDRLEEQEECLEEMLAVAKREKVNLVVHAGDLFHHSQKPPREAIRLAVEAMCSFSQIAPFVWVVGNHDWYAVEALRGFFPERILVIKDFAVRHLENPGVSIFPLPYLSLARFLGNDLGGERQGLAQEVIHGLMERWKEERNPSCWNILVAHATIEDLALHYLEANANREVFLKRGDLPSFFHYGAFGHLHDLIPLSDPFPIRYPSSLVLDNFKQVGRKGGGFVIVELREGERARITPHFFESSRLLSFDLVEKIEERAVEEMILKKVGPARNYVRLRVKEEVMDAEWLRSLKGLQGENWEVVLVEVIPKEREILVEQESVDVDTIPDLFSRFCQEYRFPGDVVGLFEAYYRQALEEEGTE